jgi:hypothetical protein
MKKMLCGLFLGMLLVTAPGCWRKKKCCTMHEETIEYVEHTTDRVSGPAGWGATEEELEESELVEVLK